VLVERKEGAVEKSLEPISTGSSSPARGNQDAERKKVKRCLESQHTAAYYWTLKDPSQKGVTGVVRHGEGNIQKSVKPY